MREQTPLKIRESLTEHDSEAKQAMAYWEKQFKNFPPALSLPTYRTGSVPQSELTFRTHTFSVPSEIKQTIQTSLTKAYLTAFACLMYRYSLQKDIVVGWLQPTNDWILRLGISGDVTFSDLSAHIQLS